MHFKSNWTLSIYISIFASKPNVFKDRYRKIKPLPLIITWPEFYFILINEYILPLNMMPLKYSKLWRKKKDLRVESLLRNDKALNVSEVFWMRLEERLSEWNTLSYRFPFKTFFLEISFHINLDENSLNWKIYISK